ncbi:hypothetical protein VNO77_20111 [Canavalia gladiata]|uniref:S-adenosylmethionine synthetase C-terminal domain-containing protein n=1 Tax=Canavalia gladiata TaxID=3824 RepID=A0AAN9LTX0_CANGL
MTMELSANEKENDIEVKNHGVVRDTVRKDPETMVEIASCPININSCDFSLLLHFRVYNFFDSEGMRMNHRDLQISKKFDAHLTEVLKNGTCPWLRLDGKTQVTIEYYNNKGAHSGGTFSGKDPTKIDRSDAYMVRQASKNIVASGLARRCMMQVSSAIGVHEPLFGFVDSYDTGKIPNKEILHIVKENFDFKPGISPSTLISRGGGNNNFLKTVAYGHFGRDDPDFT